MHIDRAERGPLVVLRVEPREPAGLIIAVRTAVPAGYLQHVYRAARYVYWVPETASLEHRDPNAESVASSAEAIRFAIEDELGLSLEPAPTVDWGRLQLSDRDAVAAALFGRA